MDFHAVLSVVAIFGAASIARALADRSRAERLRKARQGAAFEQFADYFGSQGISNRVVQETYRYLQCLMKARDFPVRRGDSLRDVYGIGRMWDITLGQALEDLIGWCGGREPMPEEIEAGTRLRTVEDLIRYLDGLRSYPLTTGAAPGPLVPATGNDDTVDSPQSQVSWAATAPDPATRSVVVAYHDGSDQNVVYRQAGLEDTQTTLVGPLTLGTGLSFGVDRGDLYLFYRTAAGALAQRRFLAPGLGLDVTDTVLDPGGGGTDNGAPTARRFLSDAFAVVAWSKYPGSGLNTQVLEQAFWTSRPCLTGLTASATTFTPLAGQTTTLSYSLWDNQTSPLAVSVKVYDSQNALVRTLTASQAAVVPPAAPLAQSLVWDGTDDMGQVVPAGTYTVKASATDTGGDGLAIPEQVVTLTVSRQATTCSGYDRLSQLTSAGLVGATPTGYGYDPAGNRLTKTPPGATPIGYQYDRADRLTSAGTTGYTLNANGNTVARGSDTFTYDQANRLTSATIACVTTTYTYDGDGKRVSTTAGGVTTRYAYDVGGGLPVLLDDGTRKYVWGATGLEYSVNSANTATVYHTDGLGSVRALTDATN
jgi:YD repeat-containing protein